MIYMDGRGFLDSFVSVSGSRHGAGIVAHRPPGNKTRDRFDFAARVVEETVCRDQMEDPNSEMSRSYSEMVFALLTYLPQLEGQ